MVKAAAIWLCSDSFSCLSEELMFEVSGWYSSFSQGLAFFSSLQFMSFAPIPLTILGRWGLDAALAIGRCSMSRVSHRRNCQFQKTDDFCLFSFLSRCFLVLFFLGKNEVCLFLIVDRIQTVVSLTEQILPIEDTKISYFVSCWWSSAFPLVLYLFTVSDNFWTVTCTLT